MSGLSTLIERNREFAASGKHAQLGTRPNFPVVFVTCLDPRVEPADVFGIGLGDAAVLRNVSGRITPAVVSDLAFMSMSMEAAIPEGPLFEVAIVHHTGCGAKALSNDTMRERYAERIGANAREFGDYGSDPKTTVATDVERLLSAPAVSDRVRVSGHVYDMESGLVSTIVPATSRAESASIP